MLNKAIIDLKLIKENARLIKATLPSTTKFCAVVKDNAYGHGLVEVASAIYRFADYYAVKNIEEAKTLRLGGIDKDILILVPIRIDEIEDAVRFNLTVTVSNMLDARRLSVVINKLKCKIKVHIKYNTGMNRQGLDNTDELKRVIELLINNKNIIIEGFFSHLGKPESNRELKKQVDKFLLAKKIFISYNIKVISHISASGGFLKKEYFDMVRIGILLYGYTPFKSNIPVKKAMEIQVPFVAKRKLCFFDKALYGLRKNFFKKEVYLIRLGYGDGVFRNKIKGQFSNKCMDLSLIEKTAKFGRFDNENFIIDDFDVLAKKYHTISYEIMTNITKNCEKIYRR